MVKVSIIVPIYKVEQYLERCIESLIHQTMKDIEIILVDDGSPDNCPAICDRYAKQDSRIKVIHKANGGVSAARNDGFEIATGEWVIFCDSDDWMELDACEVLYKAGTQHDADVVIGDINRITESRSERKYLFENEFVYTEPKDREQLVITTLYPQCCKSARSTMGYGGPWNKAVRRKFLMDNDIHFNTNVDGVCDDRLHNAEIYSLAAKVVYIQMPVYNYVLVENSITRSYKEKVKEINMKIFSAYTDLLNKSLKPADGNAAIFAGGGANAYYSLVVWRLEEAINLYFFNKKNRNSFKNKIKDLRETMLSEPYHTAALHVETENLSKIQNVLVKGIRRKSSVYIWVMYTIRTMLHRFRN